MARTGGATGGGNGEPSPPAGSPATAVAAVAGRGETASLREPRAGDELSLATVSLATRSTAVAGPRRGGTAALAGDPDR
ncbi:MAG TPA: hypothetical protein PLC86_08435, partial [Candidatus Accumulibacter phosphatis]|nr:hypothetical protein [Candidatus Accumulibacter phosphatis]